MIETSRMLQRSGDVLFQELDGEVVLYHPPTNGVVTLDQIGSIVWLALEAPGSIDEIAPDLAAAFDADVDVVQADVLALLGQLHELGMVVDHH